MATYTMTKTCAPDDEKSTPVITKKPEKPKSASQYVLLNKAISRMLERRSETKFAPSPPCYDGSPVITKKPEKPKSASQYFLLNKAISGMLERRGETKFAP